jgi:LysR family pca operon transcriptional activator
MDLIQLKRFLVAAEAGNLRRAATLLHVSQPALTQSIKSLETILGVELFERSARGVTLTPSGRALVPRARMMLNERERISRDLEELRNENAARIAVGVGPYFSRQLFPAALLRTLDTHPRAKVQVVEAHTTQLVRMLQEGGIELAFCVRNPVIDDDRSLEFEALYTERYSIMARVGHPLFRRRRITDRDVAAHSWVVHDSQATATYLGRHFERLGIDPPQWSITSLSLPLMVALLIKSDLLALLPEDFVRPEVAASRLRRVTGHGIRVDGAAGILTRRDAVLGPAAKELVSNLRSACAEARRDLARVHPPARGSGEGLPESSLT